MCVEVHFNPWDSISVFVCLMKGEYDSTLVWPFKGDIKMQLMDHDRYHSHRKLSITFGDRPESAAACQRVTSEEKGPGWGSSNFMMMSMVEPDSYEFRMKYVLNDRLTFRVTEVVIHAVCVRYL